MKIFINQNERNTSGVLLLSNLFYESLIKKGWELYNYDKINDAFWENDSLIIRERRPHLHSYKGKYEINESTLNSIRFRTHPDVVAVFEELGLDSCIHQDARSFEKSILKFVEIPEDIPLDTLNIGHDVSSVLEGGFGVEYLIQKRIWK